MKISHDRASIAQALQKLKIQDIMHTDGLSFVLITYEKGELIASPDKPLKHLLFYMDGRGKIYNLRDDSSYSPICSIGPGSFLGDMEFSSSASETFFVEAESELRFLGLEIELNRSQLEEDARFLRFLIRFMAQKLDMSLQTSNSSEILRDRLMIYIRHYCKDSYLTDIGRATLHLHCSRRQLQRILKDLCEEGYLEREAKGRYRIMR